MLYLSKFNKFFARNFILICIILFVFFLVGGFLVYKKHQELKDAMISLEGHYARMLGAQEQEQEIVRLLNDVQKILGAEIVDINGQDSGSHVLQQLRQKLTEGGLTVVSSQLKSPEAYGSFMKTEILITSEGKLASIYNFLENNISHQKKYILDNLEISLKGNLQSLNPEVEQIMMVKMSISFLQRGLE